MTGNRKYKPKNVIFGKKEEKNGVIINEAKIIVFTNLSFSNLFFFKNKRNKRGTAKNRAKKIKTAKYKKSL